MSEEPLTADPQANNGARPGEEYVVVARRYRPQTFDELIGQEHVAQALKQAIATGRIGHAYLFTGARGVGKTSAARVFAKALNCTSADGPTPDPCGACEVCRGVASGDDVDVLEIDGASNRGIDEIRQLRQNAAVRPSRARMKVYIIDEVHMLTKEAFNALLKTLEEPPEHVKFVFATTEPNKIPITILSRCQRFDFAGIEGASIQARLAQIALAEGVEIDDDALATLAVRAAGSMRDSQSLLEQLLAVAGGKITAEDVNSLLGIAPAERIISLVERLADRDAAAALAELDAALGGGADVGQLMDQLLGCYRDLMALAVGCGAERLLYALPAQIDQLNALAQRLGVQTLLAILQILDQTAARLRISMHGRTLAEMAIVRISNLEDLDELAQMIAAVRDGAPLPKRPTEPAPDKSPARQSAAKKGPPIETAAPVAVGTQAQEEASASAAQGPPPSPAAQSSPTTQTPAAPQPASANGSVSQVDAAPSGGLASMYSANLASPEVSSIPQAPKKSRRELLAEVEKLPFVQKAMDLFAVEPGKLRYNPPK